MPALTLAGAGSLCNLPPTVDQLRRGHDLFIGLKQWRNGSRAGFRHE